MMVLMKEVDSLKATFVAGNRALSLEIFIHWLKEELQEEKGSSWVVALRTGLTTGRKTRR
jgi:hypothetical protein